MDPKIFADLEIKSIGEDEPVYSVKLGGHEISQFVKGLTLNINACNFAELTLMVNTEKISVNSRCLWNIPEPYSGLLEEKKIASPEIKACEQNELLGTESNPS